MIWPLSLTIFFGLSIMFIGILFMHVLVPIISIILVFAGGFIASVSLWEFVDIFNNPPYTNNYTNDWL